MYYSLRWISWQKFHICIKLCLNNKNFTLFFPQVIFQLALELLRLHLPIFNASHAREEVSETLMHLTQFFRCLSPPSLTQSNAESASSMVPLSPLPVGAVLSAGSISVEQLLKSARVNFSEVVTRERIEALRMACRIKVIHALSTNCVKEIVRALQPQLSARPEDLAAICFSFKVPETLSNGHLIGLRYLD